MAMDSAISNESLLQADQSSRYRRKLNFFITLIIIFTIIVTAIISIFIILKHNIDSQSLAANPSKSIQSICHLTFSHTSHRYYHIPKTFIIASFAIFDDDLNSRPFDSRLCIKSLSSLARNQSRTNPSKIFALSLLPAIEKLNRTTYLKLHNLEDQPALMNCTILLNTSLTHLTRSLTRIGVDPDEDILMDKEVAGDLKTWITAAASDLETCLKGFKEKDYYKYRRLDGNSYRVRFNAVMARRYVVNSIVILENLDNIFDMFYPPKESVLGSFLMTFDSFVSLGLFCSQFLLLAALFAVLLRLDRRK